VSARLSHVVGFDDAPFARAHRGDVLVVGAVYAGARLEGVLAGRVRRDGANATRVIADLVRRSRFRAHLQLVLLQGIAFAASTSSTCGRCTTRSASRCWSWGASGRTSRGSARRC
jgi:hypothetical protein